MKKTVFTLGLIGGIIAIMISLGMFIWGGIQPSNYEFGRQIMTSGAISIIFSVMGLVSSILAEKNNKLFGILLILSAIGGLFTTLFFYVIPAILFIIAGILALIPEKNKNTI
ncbi:protein of unknown function DUF4064 [Gottschalkia purinilytica]|uniref:DUF4064 domain-containing protein n=1 Tax=Gottschalkia purinilytica TaxID=1503 RepID=A0A0L0W8D8_GOTPU|nr:DUF4064 domain-containing protein [Gottschalkia purinilytica]KNF07838.1 protein of unknown function DUF4064 [Gottschalkia purinilytica]